MCELFAKTFSCDPKLYFMTQQKLDCDRLKSHFVGVLFFKCLFSPVLLSFICYMLTIAKRRSCFAHEGGNVVELGVSAVICILIVVAVDMNNKDTQFVLRIESYTIGLITDYNSSVSNISLKCIENYKISENYWRFKI